MDFSVGSVHWQEKQGQDIQKEIDENGVANFEEFFRQRLERWREIEVNIAITGDSGTGKSSFMNRIRGLKDDDEGAAEVSVIESTVSEPTPFEHPTNPNIKYWDLPGIGTPNYPDLETYCTKLKELKMPLEEYHAFLIFTAHRFSENDLKLAEKIKSIGKRFFFVRTKIDVNVQSEMEEKRLFNEDAMLKEIRRNCSENLGNLLQNEQDIFLISNRSRDLEKWDFKRLTLAIINTLETIQQETLTLSLDKVLTRLSPDLFRKKVEVLKGRIWMVAAASAVAAFVPVPGLSLAVDAKLILGELSFYRTQLGIPDKSTKEYKALPFSVQEKIGKVSLTTVAQLGGFLARYSAEAALEDVMRYVPILGLTIASGMSFVATCCALRKLLNYVEEVALLVIKEAAEKAGKEID